MFRFFAISISAFLLLTISGYGQKIRYRDIYPMLVAQRYDDVEPLLKTFIAAEPDHSNANFQMGLLFSWHAYKNDILKDTDVLLINADSAIFYLQTAASIIDEKEISKNEDLYQSYNRRDLKTGKFGVKLEDIHSDIESKIKNLQEYTEKARLLKGSFSKAITYYDSAHQLYLDLAKNYSTANDLYIRADLKTTEKFKAIGKNFDSAYVYFQKYLDVLKTLERSAINLKVNLVPVVNFKEDGSARVNFYDKRLELWDYSNWSNETSKVIETQIKPLKVKVTTYFDYLNNLYQMVRNDMVTSMANLPERPQIQLVEEIRKFDSDALPVSLFNFQINELRYTYLLNNAVTDSSAIDELLQRSKLAIKYVASADSILTLLKMRNLEQDEKKYQELVTNKFNSADGLKSYLTVKTAEVRNSYSIARTNETYWENRSLWAINKGDSIQLFVSEKASSTGYQTLAVSTGPDENRPRFISGTYKNDTGQEGFVAEIAADRSIKWITSIDLDSLAKNSEKIFVNLPETENKEAIANFYIENNNRVKTLLVRTDATGKVAWINTLNLAKVPQRVDFNETLSEAIIYLDESNSGNAGSKVGIIIIDKEGKIKQQG